MTTEQDQQSRAAYEDGKWYWVEHDGWGHNPPIIAPARYRADCDSWYSFDFSGITTRYIKVLEPCERQAARALPDGVVPVAEVLSSRPGNDTSIIDKAFAAGTKLFTAAQVQAMGRVPPGWQPVPVEPTGEMLLAIMSSGEVDVLRETPEKHQVLLIDRAGIPDRYTALLAAAPRPPAAQERKTMACACGDEFPIDSYGAGFLDAKGKCFGCDAADEAAHGIKEAD